MTYEMKDAMGVIGSLQRAQRQSLVGIRSLVSFLVCLHWSGTMGHRDRSFGRTAHVMVCVSFVYDIRCGRLVWPVCMVQQ